MKKIICATMVFLLSGALSFNSMAGDFDAELGKHNNEAIVKQEPVITKELLKDETFVNLLIEKPEVVVKLYNNIVNVKQRQITGDEKKKIAEAKSIDEMENEKAIECDVTLTTLEYYENNEEITYSVLLAETKTSTGSAHQDGVYLSGCIGWIDNFGPFNEFCYCSGSRSGGILGQGYYQAQRGTDTMCSGNFNDSFYDTGDGTYTGLSFWMNIKSPATLLNGTKVQLHIQTGFFD